MKYQNIHSGEVLEWTEEVGAEGKIIMVCEDGVRWLLDGTPSDVSLPSGFPRMPPFLIHNVPMTEEMYPERHGWGHDEESA